MEFMSLDYAFSVSLSDFVSGYVSRFFFFVCNSIFPIFFLLRGSRLYNIFSVLYLFFFLSIIFFLLLPIFVISFHLGNFKNEKVS